MLGGIVVMKNGYLKVFALVVIFGPFVLLFLAVSHGLLSDRQWAIGGVAWAVLLPFVILALRKWLASRRATANEESTRPDDETRRRMLWVIWLNRGWVALLAVSLLFGVGTGIVHRAWLPTLFGVTVNLLLMYAAIQGIKRRKRLMNLR